MNNAQQPETPRLNHEYTIRGEQPPEFLRDKRRHSVEPTGGGCVKLIFDILTALKRPRVEIKKTDKTD